MEPFTNYLKIFFNDKSYIIELPNYIEEMTTASFYTKNENNEPKSIEISSEKVKDILIPIIELQNGSLIYYKQNKVVSNLDNLFNSGESKQNDLYNTMKEIYKDKNRIINLSSNGGSSISSLERLTNENKNFNAFKETISEIPTKNEKPDENNSENFIISMFEKNEKELKKKIEELRDKNDELKDELKKNIKSLSEENKNLTKELSEKQKIIKTFTKTKINSVELLCVPGTKTKKDKEKESSSFFYDFYPGLNYSCYGVYECLIEDNNLIKNYVIPNIYSILKYELLNKNKNNKNNINDYKKIFSECYELINEKLSLSSTKENSKQKLKDLSITNLSFSFLLFCDEEIISINLGNSQIKKCQYDSISKKIECINLSEEKTNENIIKELNRNLEENLEIKLFPYNKNDKFFVIGNNQFWEYVSPDNIIDIMNGYYINNDSKGAINKLYEVSRAKLIFDNYIDDISIIMIFLNEEN